MRLESVTAVITGASGYLGSQIAIALGRAGCNCICQYHTNKQKALEVVDQIAGHGQQAIAVQADLTVPEQIEKLFKKANEIDTDMNLTSAILTSRVFCRELDKKFGRTEDVIGKIINISGVGGVRPWAKYVLYCSSKAAFIGATKALAKELAPSVCVNSIAPGLLTWPQGFDQKQKERQLSFIPLGRKAEPDDITAALIFLLENDYITGQVLNVDGGRCI
ncbi:MAG: SDR family NAD(P)-dependent oxidoreductase [Planctomycetota bacterium]|jgi:NAD(P)-dependent dehydrogenase (short-subunit alcohol dehydrogenase family)